MSNKETTKIEGDVYITTSLEPSIYGSGNLSIDGSILSGTWSGGVIPISKGGTGATTASSAFDALAPTTTQGDIIYRNATTNVRLAPGTSGQVLITGGAGANPSWSSLVTGVSSISGDSILISNVSSVGAVTLTLASASANLVFASPNGSSGTGTYRSLLNADLPVVSIAKGGTGASTVSSGFDALSPATTQGDIIYRNATTNTRLGAGTAGQVLTTGGAGANPSWSSIVSGVSSVSGDSVLISNVSSTGGVTLTLTSASANLVFASPNGSSGSGTYRSLLNADLPTVSIAKGGTGATTASAGFDALAPTTTQGDLIYRNATTNTRLAPGTAGQVLTSGGAGANPSWTTLSSGSIAVYTVSEEYSVGTNGPTLTSGAFFTRTLNTLVKFPVSDTRISLLLNVLTFAAGTYYIECIVPGIDVDSFTSRLFNVVGLTTIATGTVTEASDAAMCLYSHIKCVVTFASSTQVSVQQRVQTTRASGGGLASGYQTEVYTLMSISVLA